MLPLQLCCAEHRSKASLPKGPSARVICTQMTAGDLFIQHSWSPQKRLWVIPADTLMLLPAVFREPVEFALPQEVRASNSLVELLFSKRPVIMLWLFKSTCGLQSAANSIQAIRSQASRCEDSYSGVRKETLSLSLSFIENIVQHWGTKRGKNPQRD